MHPLYWCKQHAHADVFSSSYESNNLVLIKLLKEYSLSLFSFQMLTIDIVGYFCEFKHLFVCFIPILLLLD